MKRNFFALLGALLALCLLAGCGAAGGAKNGTAASAPAIDELQDTAAGTDGGADLIQQNTDQKIIYTAWLELESREYESTRDALLQAAEEAGGYLESSNEGGRREEGSRWIDLVLRIPTQNYTDFLQKAGETGNLLSKRQEQENVTAEYVDLEARLESLETQRTRLQELLAQAQQLEDVLKIQQQLSDTEYQIESYTAQMRALSNQVDYCTVDISLHEVQDLTVAQPSFFQRIGDAFVDGWTSFARFLQEAAIVIVYLLPLLLVAAVVVAVIVVAARRSRRRSASRPMPPRTPGTPPAAPTYDPPQNP